MWCMFFFNLTFSSTVACNGINNFNCVRWEPQFDSGQLSQRFSWEFLNRATPFQLLSSTLAPLDKCIPKCIAIEVVSISLINDLFYFSHLLLLGAPPSVALQCFRRRDCISGSTQARQEQTRKHTKTQTHTHTLDNFDNNSGKAA